MDENLIISYVNDKLCEISGYKRERMIGLPMSEIYYKVDPKVVNEKTNKLRRGEPVSTEIILKGKNGKKIPSIISAKPMFDSNDKHKGNFAVIIDFMRHDRLLLGVRLVVLPTLPEILSCSTYLKWWTLM